MVKFASHLRKGTLSRYGVNPMESVQRCITIAGKAIRNGEKPLAIYRKVIAIGTLNKRRNRNTYAVSIGCRAGIKRKYM